MLAWRWRADAARDADPAFSKRAAVVVRAPVPTYDEFCNTGFWQSMPLTIASYSSCIEAKRSTRNRFRISSQSERLLDRRFFQAAWNSRQHSCCVWSTRKTSIISNASTTDRFCSPWP